MSISYIPNTTTLIQTAIYFFLGYADSLLNGIPASSLFAYCITDIAINWKLERNL